MSEGGSPLTTLIYARRNVEQLRFWLTKILLDSEIGLADSRFWLTYYLAVKPAVKDCDWIFPMVKIRNSKSSSFDRADFTQLLGLAAMTGTIVLVGQTSAMAGWFDWLQPQLTSSNPYASCAKSLDQATIQKGIAATACAEVLHPDDMGLCVESVTAKKVEANIALAACRSVRRPLELSTCLADIHKQDDKVGLTDVLEFCRRSLLPERYGHCVVGLKGKPLEQTSAAALPTCIDASDRPTDIELLRTFESIDKVPSIRNPMDSPIVPPSFVPGPNGPSVKVTPTPSPSSNPNAPSPGTVPQLF